VSIKRFHAFHAEQDALLENLSTPAALSAMSIEPRAALSDSRIDEPVGGDFSSELAKFHARIDAQERALADDHQKLRAAERRNAELELETIFLSSGIAALQTKEITRA
jgi:hypothetical protein